MVRSVSKPGSARRSVQTAPSRASKYVRSEDIATSQRSVKLSASSKTPGRSRKAADTPNSSESRSSSRKPAAAKSSARHANSDDDVHDESPMDEEEEEEESDHDDDDDDAPHLTQHKSRFVDSEAEEASEGHESDGTEGDMHLYADDAEKSDEDADVERAKEHRRQLKKKHDALARRGEKAEKLFQQEIEKDRAHKKQEQKEDRVKREKLARAHEKLAREKRAYLRRASRWAAGERDAVSIDTQHAAGDKLMKLFLPTGSAPEARDTAVQAANYWAATKILAPIAEEAELLCSRPQRKKNETDKAYAERVSQRKVDERMKRVSGAQVRVAVQRALTAINPCITHGLYQDMRSEWVQELKRIAQEQEEKSRPTRERNEAFEAATLLVKQLRARKESDSFRALDRKEQDKLRASLLDAEVAHAKLDHERNARLHKASSQTLENALHEKADWEKDVEQLEARKKQAELYADAVRLNDISDDMERKQLARVRESASDPAKAEAAASMVERRCALINGAKDLDIKAKFEQVRKFEKLVAENPESGNAKADLKGAKIAWSSEHRIQEQYKKYLASANAAVQKCTQRIKDKRDSWGALEERIKRHKEKVAAAEENMKHCKQVIRRANQLLHDEREDEPSQSQPQQHASQKARRVSKKSSGGAAAGAAAADMDIDD